MNFNGRKLNLVGSQSKQFPVITFKNIWEMLENSELSSKTDSV